MSVGKLSLGVFRNGSNYSLIDYIIFATICKIVAKKKSTRGLYCMQYMQKIQEDNFIYLCFSKHVVSCCHQKRSKNHRNTRAANVLCWHDNCHFWSGELRGKTCIGRAERKNFVQGKMESNQSASNISKERSKEFYVVTAWYWKMLRNMKVQRKNHHPVVLMGC